MTRKEELIRKFDLTSGKRTLSYIVYAVQNPEGFMELITISDGFYQKLDFILRAFDDNLELYNNKKVKIVDYLIV